ncbi:MAPEG family protein [Phenylobacterium sp.]|uniref:MAPEG family protein n=1 Tax=Phenylobacterium sp. TaxID=1871053 RepID=UPI00120EE0C9|nr:MAPEG family protein [Phenylobacterium sp.]THD61999.1 MAG: MAPEG family protein [Phenylobacterium sp.]
MIRKQILIALGMLAAVAVCVFVASRAMGSHAAAPLAVAERLALAARWMLVPALCLFAGLGLTANQRFLRADAIDGGPTAKPGFLEINLRYNQNTLEQTVLAAVAWTGLALELTPRDLGLIPALAGLFAVGRAAFFLGYLYAPWARAFGLGLTFYPAVATLVWLAIRLFA